MYKKSLVSLLCIVIMLFAAGCGSGNGGDNTGNTGFTLPQEPNPQEKFLSYDSVFGPTNDTGRSMIVVISDVHLGDQRSIDEGYGWCIQNREKLVTFLKVLPTRPAVKELVIAGDFFDEWVAPMEHDTFNGFGHDDEAQSKFLDTIVKANSDVIDAMNEVIASGIKVTYVPGNHDMLVSAGDINRIFPGMHQARDTSGLGKYTPQNVQELVIEHGHRYDLFNAPDSFSNRSHTENPNAILPPGFFVSKIAASNNYRLQPTIEVEKNEAIDMLEDSHSESAEDSLINSYKIAWDIILSQVKPKEDRNAKIIKTGIDGYTAAYSINDLAASHPLLYSDIQENWKKRQTDNKVASHILVEFAILVGAIEGAFDWQSRTQYFSEDRHKRVVVFGHSHKPVIKRYYTFWGFTTQKGVYANSGSWVDHGDHSCSFVVIEPVSSSIQVSVAQFVSDNLLRPLGSDSVKR